jgi:tetratricopeptide (TPR) repeat protein
MVDLLSFRALQMSPHRLMRRLTLFALAVLLTAIIACGGADREPLRTSPERRATPSEESAEDGSAGADAEPREISTDTAIADDTGAGTPERDASQQVVEEGKGYLITGQAVEAERRFDHATRIDPTNGFAYYWLGRARVEAGDPAAATGVLEKAESLLGPYPEWRDRAARLLASVR